MANWSFAEITENALWRLFESQPNSGPPCPSQSIDHCPVLHVAVTAMAEPQPKQSEDGRERLLELIRRGTKAEPIYRALYERRYGEVPDE